MIILINGIIFSILENNYSRKIIGFDDFGKFTKQNRKEDKDFIHQWIKDTGGKGINLLELQEIFEETKFANYDLVKGNIVKTIPTKHCLQRYKYKKRAANAALF